MQEKGLWLFLHGSDRHINVRPTSATKQHLWGPRIQIHEQESVKKKKFYGDYFFYFLSSPLVARQRLISGLYSRWYADFIPFESLC